MKKIILVLSVIIMLNGCDSGIGINKANSNRIIKKEHNGDYQIIEIDGHEYIRALGGGICPLTTDSTKNK